MDAGDAEAKAVEVHYITLNHLATNIEKKIAEVDSASTKNTFIPLKTGEDEFPFDFVKSRTQLFVRHVRIVEFVHAQRRPPSHEAHEASRHDNDVSDYVNYIRSEETPYIRYDRHAKSFYSIGNELLDHRSFIRSSVSNYTLRGS